MRKIIFYSVIALLTVVFSINVEAQTIVFNNNTQENLNCASTPYTLVNSGGASYGPGELFIKTICTNGDPLAVEFVSAFFGNPSDFLCVYDGTSTTDPVLFCLNESSTLNPGELIRSSYNNSSGCLTFQFSSAPASAGGDFELDLVCLPPCKLLAGIVDTTNPPLEADGIYVNLCPGDSLTLSAYGVYDPNPNFYTQSDATSTFIWDFGDGTSDTGMVVTHAYDASQIYVLDLIVEDSAGCRSINEVNLRARQTPMPTVTFDPNSPQACEGDTIALTGGLLGITIGDTSFLDTIFSQSSAVVVDTVFLPDDSDGISGNGVTTPVIYPLDIFGYIPGTFLSDVNDLYSVCLDIEHSFVGDVDIVLQCPNGQTVSLVDFSPPGTPGNYLGNANDGDGFNPSPGTPFTYCWSPASTSGSIDVGEPALANTPILAGTYEAVGNWTDLVGCPLNGTWNLLISDDYGSDNGYTFGASIDFNPEYLLDPDTFYVSYLNPNWNPASELIGNLNDTTVLFSSDDAQNDIVTFNVENNIGCEITDSVEISILSPQVNTFGDTAICIGDTVEIGFEVEQAIPSSCSILFDLDDSFGDGWNGASLTVLVDGVPAANFAATGSGSNFTFELDGTSTLSLQYAPGIFENEVSYTVTDAEGNVLFSDGPFPTVGQVFTYSCQPVDYQLVDAFVYDTICPFTFDMFDSFGDGWNGANFDVSEDGVVIDNVTFTSGNSATQIVDLAPNTTISLFYSPGNWESEVSYDIYDQDGNVVLSNGAFPPTGNVYSGTVTYSSNCQITSDPGVIANWSPLTATDTATGNPYTQFVYPTQSQTYTVTADFSNGCSTESEVQIDLITFDYQLTADTEICEGEDIQLNASGSDSYAWTINNETLNDTAIANPIGTPADDVTYYVVLDSAGCRTLDSVVVVVNDLPDATINGGVNPLFFCEGSTIELTGVAVPGNTYNWTGAETGTGNPFEVGTAGNYLLTVIDANDCANANNVTVNQNDTVEFDFSDLQNILCCQDTVAFNATDFIASGNAATVLWDGAAAGNPIEVYATGDNSETTYSVAVTADNGCESEDEMTFETRCINPDVNTIDTIFSQVTDTFIVVYDANADADYNFNWTVSSANGGSFINPNNELGAFTGGFDPGFYDVNVAVNGIYTLNNGNTLDDCVESASSTFELVSIQDPKFPDAFSPNGDNNNEYFIPILDPLSTIVEFNVYNRWHELVYSYSANSLGWDGTYEGELQPQDVYTYFIKIQKQDGSELIEQNTVTLIR